MATVVCQDWCPPHQIGQRITLQGLPNEVIHEIAKICQKDKKGTLKRLSQTNRFFNSICHGFGLLFQTMVHPKDYVSIRHVEALLRQPLHFKYARSFTIVSGSSIPWCPSQHDDYITMEPSTMMLQSLLPNLAEVSLITSPKHYAIYTSILQNIKDSVYPGIKAFRTSQIDPDMVRTITRLFPGLEKLHLTSSKKSEGYGGYGPLFELIVQRPMELDPFQSLTCLTSVQLDWHQWRWCERDFVNIQLVFPNIERLSLRGKLHALNVEKLIVAISAFPRLRYLCVDAERLQHPGPFLDGMTSRRDIGPEHVGSGDDRLLKEMRRGRTRRSKPTMSYRFKGQVASALSLLWDPRLNNRLESVCLCNKDTGDSRLYTRCEPTKPEDPPMRVNIEREYAWDRKAENGGPGDFWFHGVPAFMMGEREWLRPRQSLDTAMFKYGEWN